MKSKIEYRFFEPQDQELRASMENDQMVIEGYAAKYNVKSHLLTEKGQTFIEVLERGTFSNHIKDDVFLTFNHNRDKVLARTTNNTLMLSDDEIGLKFRAVLNNTSDSKDLYERVLRGDINENSFGFIPDAKKQKLERFIGSDPIKRISGIENLVDVSVVTKAAYPQTEVYARELDDFEEPEPVKINQDKELNQLELIKLKLKK